MIVTIYTLMLCFGIFSTHEKSNLRAFYVSEKEMLWPEAQAFCRANYTDLATINTEDDVSDLRDLIPKKTAQIGYYGQLRASDGTPVDYIPWKDDPCVTCACAAIVNGCVKWKSCSDKETFLCYAKANSGFQLKVIDGRKNWSEAQNYCRENFTDLAAYTNQSQYEEIIKLSVPNKSRWIGIKYDNRAFVWSDGTISNYTFNCKNKLHCGILQKLPSPHDQPKCTSCFNDGTALCYKDKIEIHSQKMTWPNAVAYCKDKNKRLLAIENHPDQLILEHWLKKKVSVPVWIGLVQSRVFGFWYWTSDKIVNYTNWKDNKRPSLPHPQNCGAIDKNDGYQWSAKNCFRKLPFLCQD